MGLTAPHPLPQWWDSASKHACGIGTPRPAAMPKPAPKWAAQEWATWNAWSAWKNAGGHAPKPALPWLTPTDGKRAPLWARRLRGEWLNVHGIPAPPHDPERPECRWTTEQIGGFGFRLAWEFTRAGWTPGSLVDRVKSAIEPHTGKRINYLSIEGYPAWRGATFPDGGSSDNERFFDEFIRACHANGLQARVWERTDHVQAAGGFQHIKELLARYPFDVYEADLEDMDKVDPAIAALFAADPVLKDMPRSTLYAGMWDARYYDPWIKAQFAAGIQAYSHEDWAGGFPVPPGIAGSMERGAYWRGCLPIPGLNGLCAIPMIGVNQEGDGGIAHQLPTLVQFGGNYGFEWFATSSPSDLAVFGV